MALNTRLPSPVSTTGRIIKLTTFNGRPLGNSSLGMKSPMVQRSRAVILATNSSPGWLCVLYMPFRSLVDGLSKWCVLIEWMALVISSRLIVHDANGKFRHCWMLQSLVEPSWKHSSTGKRSQKPSMRSLVLR